MPTLERSYLTGRLLPRLENENTDERGYTIPPSILVDSYSTSLA